ncbi:MAG: 23S rRNA (uracil(1939)-C(5))-methyltransferase RlmD [Candidatus Latescibacterota bacterium]
MPIHKGDLIEVQFTGLSYKGYGLGRYDGREVSAMGPLPGEHAQVRVLRKPRHRLVGEIENILASPFDRPAPRCQHFGICGGCWGQDVAYQDQLRLKEGIVRGYLEPLAETSTFSPIIPAPEDWAYRNKMEFSFDRDADGAFQLGLHLRGRFDQLFDLNACPIAPPLFAEIVRFIRAFAQEHGLPVYDQRRKNGLLRFLTIREGRGTGEVMVAITATRRNEAFEGMAAVLVAQFPAIRSVILVINNSLGQIAYGKEEDVLAGSATIRETLRVGDVERTFALSFRSFLQTNTHAAEQLYQIVLEHAQLTGGERVLDAFCGIGTITAFLAEKAQRVVGVEMISDAVENARTNMAANGIHNVDFVVGPAEKVFPELDGHFDVGVVDPPRAGIHPKALQRLIELAPGRLIYVSCNPKTLADDIRVLRALYTVKNVQPVDLFPHTPHVETVVEMTAGQEEG